jgi:hypothetical protein
MNRRHVLAGLSAVAGHALFPDVLGAFGRIAAALDAQPDAWTPVLVNASQATVLAEVVETIIPTTATPGAKAARVHVFVDLALARCVAPEKQQPVLAALDGLGNGFVAASPADRAARLGALDKDAFALLKELTVLGYFTSEIGATHALAYDKVPGGYWGCLDLKPGQRGWATR